MVRTSAAAVLRVLLIVVLLSVSLFGMAAGNSLAGTVGGFVIAGAIPVRSFGGRDWTLLPCGVFVAALVAISSVAEIYVALGIATVIKSFGTTRYLASASKTATVLESASCGLLLAWWSAMSMVARTDSFSSGYPISYWAVLTVLLAIALWFVGDVALRLAFSEDRKTSPRFRLRILMRDAPLAVVMLSASATVAAMWQYSPGWALLMSVGPFAVAHSLFTSYARAERVEELTVRALGRLPEAAGVSPSGHSAEVASLSVGIGKLRGMSGPDLSRLERAAHLHDIGLLCAMNAETRRSGFLTSDKCRWGAEMLSSSRVLHIEAELIRRAGEPYRRPGADPHPEFDLRSQILGVACAYEGLSASGLSADEVVELLYTESFFLHAPWAVALIRPALGLAAQASSEKPLP